MPEEILLDCHNHSTLSPDGLNSPREMVERAIELGIKYYTLTDHIEINLFNDSKFLYEKPVREASVILPQLKQEFVDKISVFYGAELGQPLHNIQLTTGLLARYDYDFLIGSCHYVRGYDDFYLLNYNEIQPETVLDKYFDELLEMAEWGGFDSLGHLTYPLRYICGEFGIKVDMKKYDKIIRKIFKTLVKNNMGIEINTSGLRQKIGVTLPDYAYVRLFRELGGEIITIGSDAHCTKDLGRGIADGIAIAKKAGFDSICCFEKRQPKFIKI